MISLAHETISKTELESAADFLKSGNKLTKGSKTLEFESQFGKTLHSKYSVYVNSGSSANLLVAAALKESGKLRNNLVVCPSLSWVTTITPFTHLGYEVILCEADSNNLGVDLEMLEELFEKKRPALLVLVHILGHGADMKKISELCLKYEVLIVEDSCEALGSVSSDGVSLGTHGIAGTFSFYYGHHISTIEGGMVVTNDFELWQIMLSMRSHGWSRDLSPEMKDKLVEKYEIDEFRNLYTFYWPGFNFRSTDLQAFIGLMQLQKLQDIVKIREDNFYHYEKKLTNFWTQSSQMQVLSSFAFGIAVNNRKEFAAKIYAEGIESRPLVCGNIGRHPFWTNKSPAPNFPFADFIHDYGMYLPNHANLTTQEIDFISELVHEYAEPIFIN